MSRMRRSNFAKSKMLGCRNSCFAGLLHVRVVFTFFCCGSRQSNITLFEEEDVLKGLKQRLTSLKEEAGILKMFIAQNQNHPMFIFLHYHSEKTNR